MCESRNGPFHPLLARNEASLNRLASFESPVGTAADKELFVMRTNMEIMKKDLAATREINTKVASIACVYSSFLLLNDHLIRLPNAMKELSMLKEKNMQLENRVR